MKILYGFYLLLAILLLASCERDWFFSIEDLKNPSYPTFCISLKEGCKGEGVALNTIYIIEVNNEGRELKRMWVITAIKNIAVKQVKYGKTPNGWKELNAAVPLESNKWYSINGKFYFKMINNKALIKDRQEFYKINKNNL